MRPLLLYHRNGCHLCEEMLVQLEQLQRNREFSLELIDVDRSSADLAGYHARLPVLETPEGDCLCEYFLDENALLNYLDGG